MAGITGTHADPAAKVCRSCAYYVDRTDDFGGLVDMIVEWDGCAHPLAAHVITGAPTACAWQRGLIAERGGISLARCGLSGEWYKAAQRGQA